LRSRACDVANQYFQICGAWQNKAASIEVGSNAVAKGVVDPILSQKVRQRRGLCAKGAIFPICTNFDRMNCAAEF
jgi:hypothetical protein